VTAAGTCHFKSWRDHPVDNFGHGTRCKDFMIFDRMLVQIANMGRAFEYLIRVHDDEKTA
jgi:hypothetical protein